MKQLFLVSAMALLMPSAVLGMPADTRSIKAIQNNDIAAVVVPALPEKNK